MLNSRRWEDRFGAITGSQTLIEIVYDPKNDNKEQESVNYIVDNFMWDYFTGHQFPKLILDEEFRVRN